MLSNFPNEILLVNEKCLTFLLQLSPTIKEMQENMRTIFFLWKIATCKERKHGLEL